MQIHVNVKPNSSKSEIIKLDEYSYNVYLKKQAKDGKANKELVSLLKKHFKGQIKIIKGKTTKKKLIEVKT